MNYRLFIGLDYYEDDFRQTHNKYYVLDLLKIYFKNFTAIEGFGCYNGELEDCLIIELINCSMPKTYIEDKVGDIAYTLKQECILVQVYDNVDNKLITE